MVHRTFEVRDGPQARVDRRSLQIQCQLVIVPDRKRKSSRLTLGNVHSMPCKSSPLPDERSLFREQTWHLPADEFIRGRLLTVGVQFVLIGHVPGPRSGPVIISLGLTSSGELGALCIEGISVEVLWTANRRV